MTNCHGRATRRAMRRCWPWLLAVIIGCGSPPAPGRTSTPDYVFVSPFPGKRAVEELARSSPKPLPRREVGTSTHWRVEPAPDVSAVESRFAGITFTKELRCIAREHGKLESDTGVGQPDERLERFIIGACGGAFAKTLSRSWKSSVPESVSDEAVATTFGSRTPFPEEMRGRPAGAWITRRGQEAILTIVSRESSDDLAVTATIADPSGHVTLEGAVDADRVVAVMNRGRDGTADCEPDPATAPPKFRFTCTLSPDDPWAWIEVVARPRGEDLVDGLRALLVARRDVTGAIELTSSERSSSVGNPERVLLDRLNGLRRAARLRPLTLVLHQSATNERIAPHYFRAVAEHDRRSSADVALGLLAGWDVDGGMIRSGRFTGQLLTGAKTAESWLDAALDLPTTRTMLLEPDATQVAIGAAPPEIVGGMGVVMTLYELFDPRNRLAEEAAIYQRLGRARAGRSLPPLTSLPEMPSLERAIALVQSGQMSPRDVPAFVVARETRRLQRPLVGFHSMVRSIDAMRIPADFVAPGPLAVRVAVTTYRPLGSPWGYYAIYIIGSVPE